jgi:cytochrome P450
MIGRVGELARIDFTDLDNFAAGFPHHLFVVHRREQPVWWHEPTEHTPDGEGFWSVATHAQTHEVLRDPVTYSSERGGDRAYGGTLLQDLPVAGQVLNMMDDPRHARIRRIVSSGLTPRMIGRIEGELRLRVRALLNDVNDGEPFDFVHDIAAELPMQVICLLLGVPESEGHWLFEAVEPGFDFRGKRRAFEPDKEADSARARMFAFGTALIAEKRSHPGDDMLSAVVHASIDDDPPRLTDGELYMFFSLLFAAGSETTRNAIAGGVLALAERPDQLRLLKDNRSSLATAVEEIIRWTSPSPSKRRTATRATELGGFTISPGDKVLVWEGSANRDEQVFRSAGDFDVRRDPNPHLGFGHGIHFCLGANLARLEIRVLLEELISHVDAIEVARPVEWTRSNRHTGIRHLYLTLHRPG